MPKFKENELSIENKNTLFLQTPRDILVHVFSFFNRRELALSGAVCQRFYEISRLDVLTENAKDEVDYTHHINTQELGVNKSPTAMIQFSEQIVVDNSTDAELHFVNFATQEAYKIPTGHTENITCIVKLSDTEILTGAKDFTLRILNVPEKKCISVMESKHPITCVVKLSATRCVSGTGDGTIQLWDFATETLVSEVAAHKSRVVAVLKWNEDEIVSVDKDGTFLLWKTKQGGFSFQKLHQHKNDVITCVAKVSEDKIAYGLHGEKCVYVYSKKEDQAIPFKPQCQTAITAVCAISNTMLVSASLLGFPMIYDFKSPDEFIVIKGSNWGSHSILTLENGDLVFGFATKIKRLQFASFQPALKQAKECDDASKAEDCDAVKAEACDTSSSNAKCILM